MLQIVAQRGSASEPAWIYPPGHKLVPNIATLFKNPEGVLSGIAQEDRVNLYYTVAHHTGLSTATKPQRRAATFEYQTVLPFDIDHADTKHPWEYAEVVCSVMKTDREGCILIDSGNGIHVLFNLATPIAEASFFRDMRPYYLDILAEINRRLGAAQICGQADPKIFDAARVLRLPGTVNRKPNIPDTQCTLINYSDAVHKLDLRQLSGLGSHEQENVSPQEIRSTWPDPDFAEIVKECQFVQWAGNNINEVHEPHAFDLFSLLAVQKQNATAPWQGEEVNPRGLAEWVFTRATASRSLDRSEFSDKWEQSGKYGARKCETINQTWGKCKECPHYGKITTPLALRSKKFVGTESNGFWIRNMAGKPVKPHYGDLVRVYEKQERPAVAGDGRIFHYTGTHYIPAQEPRIKGWLETKMVPCDPVTGQFRNEFLEKVRATFMLSPDEEEQRFESSINAKLNCLNGTLDIVKGNLLEHDYRRGFKYVLPYEYKEGLSSELFLDWLATITENKTELMDSILDVMAYTLWPRYDDHVFIYLIGSGSNGKSTLIHILSALVGPQNHSSVNLQQLTTNRFAPSSLEGKLMNLSEESSGTDLGYDQLNVLKNLSAGGDSYIERKNVQGYSFRNRAKLVFSANKPPKFRENGDAIKRRLLAIPFDYKITRPDPLIEARLIEEVPAILSMLVRRIQENTARNNGAFKVSREGSDVAAAQRHVLTAGSSVNEWAREKVLSSADLSEETWISVDLAYQSYGNWCVESGMNKANKINFCAFMRDYVITQAITTSDQQWIAGRNVRVFRKTKFTEEGM